MLSNTGLDIHAVVNFSLPTWILFFEVFSPRSTRKLTAAFGLAILTRLEMILDIGSKK